MKSSVLPRFRSHFWAAIRNIFGPIWALGWSEKAVAAANRRRYYSDEVGVRRQKSAGVHFSFLMWPTARKDTDGLWRHQSE